MLKAESNWRQACDTCQSAACTVYCRADSAYLCTSCDAQVHAANRVASRHERVRVCESCQRAPAAFFCKADSASLCTACDSEIHSANPLAIRHHRVPILPISTEPESTTLVVDEDEDEDEAEAASWLLPNNNSGKNNQNNGFEYLDIDQFTDQSNQYVGDGVVPLEFEESRIHHMDHHEEQHNVHKSYNSSLVDLPIQMLSSMDREAKVLRYREKKKMRKFEKTIRYASRKAYAETRPRIKGRFAKRNDVDAEADQAFSTVLLFDTGYGIVPSF